jgi:CDP-diacylglycerol--glycerol-3-phosphate 3-phosphatidyltransferase
MAQLVFISEKNRERYLKIIKPVGDFFARTGVHPNILSVSGLVLSAVAGLLYGHGRFFWAAWVVVFAGICDTLDGQIARQTNKRSAFGAFFDSTLDRYSDMFLLIGLAYHFAGGRAFLGLNGGGTSEGTSPWTVLVIVFAIAGSFMVSYTRARAEGLGMNCKGGLMQRPERITLLIIGSLLGSIPVAGPMILKFTLLVLAVSANLTAIYRIIFIKNQLFSETQAK